MVTMAPWLDGMYTLPGLISRCTVWAAPEWIVRRQAPGFPPVSCCVVSNSTGRCR